VQPVPPQPVEPVETRTPFFADVRFPNQVKRGEVQWLSVQLKLEQSAESRSQATVAVAFAAAPRGELPPPEYVEVRLLAPDFGEQTGVWERTMTVYASRDSQPVVFLIQSDVLGRKRITVDFYHKGRMIASLNFQTEVVQSATVRGALPLLLEDPPLTLGAGVLAQRLLPEESDPLLRGTVLQQALRSSMERLRPSGSVSGIDRGWWPYLICTGEYEAGQSRAELQQALALSASTYSRAKRQAIERITAVSGGHPYFTQVICHELVAFHNETQRSYITANEVEDVLDRIVERGEAHFKFIWAEASPIERAVLLALADLLETDETVGVDPVQALLDKRAIDLNGTPLIKVLDDLEMGDILTRSGPRSNLYRFKIDLIRRWIYATRPN